MPRFTIKRLMLAVAGIGVALGLVQAYPFVAIAAFYAVLLAGASWLPARARPRIARWGFLAAATWLNASMLVFFAYQPVLHNSIYLFASSLIFLPIVPGLGMAWAAGGQGRVRWTRAAIVACACGLAFSMIATHWPLRLAFGLSSPALNRLADRVEAGGAIAPGERAGLYRVFGTTALTGDTAIIIDPDPGGISAFVRRPGPARGSSRDWLDDGPGGRWWFLDQD
ncbi:hypothetical protein OJF2_31730 [Aquisphaera giovannonii]|uniref:Uncharacterized protein n=1 Tax=Aquisphaera giovannonii TaxID=406548 RepID=A0A5B9W1U9_9BACT|nr:hypothetical protein [Aquisphaera giovannonii]QEH34632.1 hypothetical protein OJF2_31730 [Aquisphaera giovannonii]